MIDGYTREAGVRNLEREIGAVMRHVAVRIAEGQVTHAKIDAGDLPALPAGDSAALRPGELLHVARAERDDVGRGATRDHRRDLVRPGIARDALEDHLEVITRMFQPGPATYNGEHAHVISAIHEPKGLQEPRIPIVVGGNGPNRTWRLAARFADELNLDALTPQALSAAIPVIRDRCEEIERDPTTLRLSVHIWGEAGDVAPGGARQERFAEYAALGVHRIIVQGFQGVNDPGSLNSLFEDCRTAALIN